MLRSGPVGHLMGLNLSLAEEKLERRICWDHQTLTLPCFLRTVSCCLAADSMDG